MADERTETPEAGETVVEAAEAAESAGEGSGDSWAEIEALVESFDEDQPQGGGDDEPELQDDRQPEQSEQQQANGEDQQPSQQPPADARVDELYQWAQQQERQADYAQRQADTAEAVEFLRSETDEVFDDEITGAYLLAQYNSNPTIKAAFERRQSDPETWRGALKQVAKDLRAKANDRVDAQLTADREAARAAVRGQSLDGPEPQDFEQAINRMSDADFQAWKDKQGIRNDGLG